MDDFFPYQDLLELEKWNLLFGPGLFFYGVGLSCQPIKLTEMKAGLIGHWGQSGAFTFYHRQTDLYFTGTMNQFNGQGVAARIMINIINMFRK